MISGFASLAWKSYRIFAPVKLIVLVLVSVPILVQAYSAQTMRIGFQGQQNLTIAHTALLREGHMQNIDAACVSEKVALVENYEQRIPTVAIRFVWPRISSLVPTEPEG